MTNPDIPTPHEALAHFDVGAVTDIEHAGGTAGRTWKVTTPRQTYFLRVRGVRTSTRERLVFDHGLRQHLASRGVPTAVAQPTQSGERWLALGGRVFELYPYVEGRPFDFANQAELEAAARALAQYHDAAKDYAPAESHALDIAQFAWLGFCDQSSTRMDDPALQVANIEAIQAISQTEAERAAARWALERAERLTQTNAGPRYDRTLGWVIHGDYTPANLLFTHDGQVAGIFDLDWAMPGPRCRDIGDALYFFAGARDKVDSSNIWTLTQAVEFDLGKCVAFLDAYHATSPLSDDELDAIPAAFEGRWLSVRLEGMAKVDVERRLEFFGRGDIHVPVQWLDAHWARVRSAIAG